MGTAENKELVRKMYADLAKGDAEGFLGAMADDVRFRIIGTTRYSGTYEGKKELVEKLFLPIQNALEPGSAMTPVRLIAEGDCVVLEATGKGRTKTGKQYDNVYCQVIRIQNGKVKELVDYLDTELVASVFGR